MTENEGENQEKAQKKEEKKDEQKDFKNSVWLLQWFRRRIEKNRNVIALFVGQTGSGKSYSAMRLAERLDPNFSVDRVVFTVEEFLQLVNKGLPKGSVIVFDDAGLGINAREWQYLSARVFGMLTQGFRYKQIITFITVPDESFIERQSRRLAHIQFEATDVQGIMKMKLISRNTFDPERPLKKFPRIHRGISTIVVKMAKFQLPSEELREKYEAKKNAYMERKFREFENELKKLGGIAPGTTPEPEGKRRKQKRVPLMCPHCAHVWIYKGNSRDGWTNCSKCNAKVNIRENRMDKGQLDP